MTRAGTDRVVMVVPTYNERDNLEWIVGRVRASVPAVDVLVVDDGSPDGTGDLADELAAADPQVSVVHRSEKAGLGAAYLHGFRVALERGYDVVGEMDADGSHQPEQLPRLLAALEHADLVIGSRWVPGGSVVNWPLSRKVLSVGGNLYARVLLGIPLRDVTAGYRLFRRTTLEAIDLGSVESAGYIFQTDLAFRTVRAGPDRGGGADRVRRAGPRRVEDEPGRGHRVAAPHHGVGAARARSSGARRTLEETSRTRGVTPRGAGASRLSGGRR